jgi:hypothetical protein
LKVGMITLVVLCWGGRKEKRGNEVDIIGNEVAKIAKANRAQVYYHYIQLNI